MKRAFAAAIFALLVVTRPAFTAEECHDLFLSGQPERACHDNQGNYSYAVQSEHPPATTIGTGTAFNQTRSIQPQGLVPFHGFRAVRWASAIIDRAQTLGLMVRAGLHSGEIELRGDEIGGIAVNIAARIAELARGGEILVSGTVRDLVAGSGLSFDDRGDRDLKGLPTSRLFAAKT